VIHRLRSTVKTRTNRERARIVRRAATDLAGTFRQPKGHPIAIAELRRALEELGVAAGDTLLVHTATNPLYYGAPERTERYADKWDYATAFVAMLVDLLGPDGTLLMLTDSEKRYVQAHYQRELWDWRSAPSRRGLATEVFRQRADVLRSLNPMYNVSARGPRAEDLLGAHRLSSYTMDEHSPYWKLTQTGGKVAFVGIYYEINSLIHLPEYMHPQEFPRPLFYDKPFVIPCLDRELNEFDFPVMRHARYLPDWCLPPFCKWLDGKYGPIYGERRVHEAPVVVYDAKPQYDALLRAMREEDTVWYDAEWWPGVERPAGRRVRD
jgi:aminoglycoside N3'-acetyltransferase